MFLRPFDKNSRIELRRRIFEGVGPVWFGILALIRNPVFPWLPLFPGMTRPVMPE